MGILEAVGAAVAVYSAVSQNRQAKKAAEAQKQAMEAAAQAAKPAPPPAATKSPTVAYFKRANEGAPSQGMPASGLLDSFLGADTAPNLGKNSLLGK